MVKWTSDGRDNSGFPAGRVNKNGKYNSNGNNNSNNKSNNNSNNNSNNKCGGSSLRSE